MWANIEETYRRVGANLGLPQFSSTPFSITIGGMLDGVEVSASRFSSSQCVARALIRPPMHLGLAIMPAGVMNKLFEAISGVSTAGAAAPLSLLFGGDTLRVGDAEFDKAFTVHGHDAASIVALLTPAVRDALWSLQRAGLSFVLTDLHAQTRRRLVDGEDVEGDLRAVAGLARVVSNAVGGAA